LENYLQPLRRKETGVECPNTYPNFFIESIDDLIENALEEVPVPLSRAVDFLIEPEEEFRDEQPKITIQQIMG
jgi:hypothetical protein